MNRKLKANRFKFLSKACLLLVISISINLSAANFLHELVKKRLQQSGKDSVIETLQSPTSTNTFESYMPIQSIEYGFIFTDNYGITKSSERQTEKYSLKFKIKSLTELTSFKESQKTSEKLLHLNQLDSENIRQFECYSKLVNQVFNTKIKNLLSERKLQVESSVNNKADLLGLNKTKTKDLLGDLILLQKLENNSISISNQAASYEKIEDQLADKLVRQLLDGAKPLNEKLASYFDENQKNNFNIERKQLENQLSRIGKEVAWADDEKLISHIEVNHDPFQREDSYRIAFNVPGLRFDNENRSREKILLQVKETALVHEALAAKLDLQNRMIQLQTLLEQIENAKPKFARLKLIESQVKGNKDIELLTALSQFKFDLERELLENALAYYSLYLQILKELGVYGKQQDVDLLEPTWRSL